MTPKRLFKKEYAKELLQVAKEDLETAVVLQKAGLSRKENILFHVQQAIEKGLKASLCAREVEVPLVHDLNELANTIENKEKIPGHDKIYDLTQFANIRRYEEGVAVISEKEITAAIQLANEILDWIKADFKNYGL